MHAVTMQGEWMMTDKRHRMVFGDFVDKVFWLVISAFLCWIALSVTSLNEKIAVIITQMAYQSQISNDHSSQIRDLQKDVLSLKERRR